MPRHEALTVVRDFIGHWGPGRKKLIEAFDRFFAPSIVWENVGLVTTHGIAEAKAVLDQFPLAFDYFTGDIHHIAAAGNAVLTERVDHFHTADGAVIASLRLCGIFEVANGLIRHWRDYFDTAPYIGVTA